MKSTCYFLPIHTTPDLFFKWIERRISEKHNAQLSSSVGFFKISPNIERKKLPGDKEIINIYAKLYSLTVIRELPVHVLTFWIEPIRSEEIEVTAILEDDQPKGFTDLFQDIKTRFIIDFPEAQSKPDNSEILKLEDNQPEGLRGFFLDINTTLVIDFPEAQSKPGVSEILGPTPPHEEKQSRMWPFTDAKIKELLQLRRDAISNGNPIPSWTKACHRIGIDPMTVIRNRPDIRKNWMVMNWNDPGDQKV